MDARKFDEMRLESQLWLEDLKEKHKRYWMGMRWEDDTTISEQSGQKAEAEAEADLLGQSGG